MKTHILGFPRIGKKRELKKALEFYWKGKTNSAALLDTVRTLKETHWNIQKEAGLSYVTTGDFSLYDHMLDTAAMLGAVPPRFGDVPESIGLRTYFQMARGDASQNTAAMEMTKWFNTNYHYIVPEIDKYFVPRLSSRNVVEDTETAVSLGHTPKPVLVGPVTFLSLSKGVDGFNCFETLSDVVDVYVYVLSELRNHCEWIQIDEPILCADMPPEAREGFAAVYQKLNAAAGPAKLLLTTYFDALDDNLDLALSSGTGGLHIDLVHGASALESVLDQLPKEMILSAGVINGRNVWKTDLNAASSLLSKIEKRIGKERLMVGSSCSLLHSPVDVSAELKLDSQLKDWMAFSVQKCEEIRLSADAADGNPDVNALASNARSISDRKESPRLNNPKVRTRLAEVNDEMLQRNSPYANRKVAQGKLDIPLLPTTTIGSFPQTGRDSNHQASLQKGKNFRSGLYPRHENRN